MTEKEAFAARRRYSDGEAIGADVVQAINEVYEAKTAREPWQRTSLWYLSATPRIGFSDPTYFPSEKSRDHHGLRETGLNNLLRTGG